MNFFDFLRSQSLRRTGDGWIAGVCSGLAHRWGIAPVLIRLLALVLLLFGGLVIMAYAIAWLIIPRDDDGELVLEDAVRGSVSAKFAAAIALFIIGLWVSIGTADLVFGIVTFPLTTVTLLTISGVILLVSLMRSRMRTEAPVRAADQAPTESAPETRADKAFEEHAPVAGRPLHREPSRPPKPRRPLTPAVSSRFILISLALALSAAALTLLIGGTSLGTYLMAVGAILLILGLSVVLAGTKGLRARWLTLMSFLLVFPVAGATALAWFVPDPVLEEKNPAFLTTPGSTSSVSIIDNRTISIHKGDDDIDAKSMAWASYVDVDHDAPVIFTVTGTGSINLTSFGGWEITKDRQTFKTLPPQIMTPAGDPAPIDKPLTPGEFFVSWNNSGRESLVRQTATITSPEALAHPESATHVRIDYGFGDLNISEVNRDVDNTDTWIASELGYSIKTKEN